MVSVTPDHAGASALSAQVEARPGQPVKLTLQNVSLKFCVQQAFRVQEYQVSGPGWIKKANYDILATLPAGAAPDQVWPALQTLLAERFKLSFRREMKELPAYALTVATNGPKMRAATAPSIEIRFLPVSRDGGRYSSGSLRPDRASIAEFCANLSKETHRPVLTHTGIPGFFDFELEYRSVSAIPLALQKQLGLKLEPQKESIEMLIVEDAVR
jgi:uncharacterized protein (TIGR03435 family)